jgi:hypothetical protein
MKLSEKPEIVITNLDEEWLKKTHYLRSQWLIFPGLVSKDLESDTDKAKKFNAITCQFFYDGNRDLTDGEDRQSWADNFRLNILRNFMAENDVWYVSHTNWQSKTKPSKELTFIELQKEFPRSTFLYKGKDIDRLFFEFGWENLEELFHDHWNKVILPNPIFGMLIDDEYEHDLLDQSNCCEFDYGKIKLMFNTWPEENKFFTFFSMREDFDKIIKNLNPMTMDSFS